MSGDERSIRSICVAGAGIVGLSAAVAFARALPRVQVSIVETPANPAALADRMPGSLPSIHRFHSALGMDELELVRSGVASHLLGSRVENWSAAGETWYHVFGEHGLPAGQVPFQALWQRAQAAARALPFHRYTAAAALAAEGKFVHPSDDPQSPLGTYLYALRLDPELYRKRLLAAAGKLPRSSGEIAGAERRTDGGIANVVLKDGRQIEADLFVDCTGPSASLLSVVDESFEDWGRWLPCDRVHIAREAAQEPTSCDRVTATENGWIGRSALPDHTHVVSVCNEEFSGGSAMPDTVAIRTGRRPQPWVHNVLAIGDGVVAVDPLHSTNLHLAQSGILRALELLPGRDCHPLELAEYNRRTEQETTRVRDFLALHYLRSGRRDSPFWSALAERHPPDSLARTLEQFERRGRLPFFEEESFDNESWLAVLFGLGVIPVDVDPAAMSVDLDRAAAAMDGYAARIARLPAALPPYRELLAKMKAAPVR